MRGVLAATASMTLLLAACGGSDEPPAPAQTSAEEAPAPPEPVALKLKKTPKSTTDASIEITGTTDADARVVADGERAKLKDERFTITVPLDVGQNKVRLTAQAKGMEKTTETVQVKREEVVTEAPTTTAPTETTPAPTEGEAAQNPSEGLEYDLLPNGEPGYVLPKEERSLSCVGYDADTGECVGD